ncbi:N-acetylneuraminate synthase family protein [Thermodesulfobacteriota bacterium]
MKLIAETAWHHQGDFDFMKELVSEIEKHTRADIIKLHITLNREQYMAEDHPLFIEGRKREFGEMQWKEIIELVLSGDKELMLLFNDTKAVQFGMQYNPTYVEIHSACLNDVNLLGALRQYLIRETKVFLGVGGSSLYEIENAINILQHPNIVLMFGFQNFPTRYEDINFAKMRRIMRLFSEFEFGYADHTAWDEPNNILITLLGAALGMDYVEKHVTTAYGEERIDWSAAISIDMSNEIKEKMDLIEACNGDGLLRLNKGEANYSIYGPMKKAAILTKDLKAGQKLKQDMLTFKRTNQIADMSQVEVLESIGKEITKEIKAGQVLMRDHLKERMEGKIK